MQTTNVEAVTTDTHSFTLSKRSSRQLTCLRYGLVFTYFPEPWVAPAPTGAVHPPLVAS